MNIPNGATHISNGTQYYKCVGGEWYHYDEPLEQWHKSYIIGIQYLVKPL